MEYISAVLDRPQIPTTEWPIADEAEEYPRWYTESAHGEPPYPANEQYAHSLKAIRALGEVAIAGMLEEEAGQAAEEYVRRDVKTSLAEMYENDPAFKGRFEISDVYTYPIRNGQVHLKTKDGPKPMLQLVKDGAASSRAAAETDPGMALLAERDQADVGNAVRVDQMVRGETGTNTRLVASRDLGAAIRPGAPYKDKYEGMGYREGLSFLQLYFADRGELVAGTFSVDGVSDEVFDAVFAEYGAPVPPGMERSKSVMHGIERTFASREEAIAFAIQFRNRCYELQNDRRIRLSVSQFMGQHDVEINAYIRSLFVPLGMSIASGIKDRALHNFVHSLLLLRDTRGMKPAVVDHLRRIHASERFNDEDGRFMLGVALYAVAEALYDDARRFAGGVASTTGRASKIATYYYVDLVPGMQTPLEIIKHLAMSVHAGIGAGREYKGPCSGRVSLANAGQGEGMPDLLNPQGAFGGREGDNKESLDEDQFGPLTFNCPNCKVENRRRPGSKKYFIRVCWHCRKPIPGCGPEESGKGNKEDKAPSFTLAFTLPRSKKSLMRK